MSTPRAAPERSTWRARAVFAVAALFVLFQLVLQTFPSVMRDGLVVDLSLSGAGFGGLSSSFYYPYILLQVPAGFLVARFGPRRILLLSAILCAAGAFLFALAENAWTADATRILMGLGAGPTVVCAMTLAARWFPPASFPLLVALTEMSGMAGAAVGQEILGLLVETAGWRNSMTGCGIFALILLVLIAVIVRDRPTNRTPAGDELASWPPLREVATTLLHPSVLLRAVAGGLVAAAGVSFGMLWGVPFLQNHQHLSLPAAALAGSFYFWGCLPGMWFFAKACQRWNPAKLLILGSFGGTFLLAGILFVPLPNFLLCTAMFLLGLTNSSYAMTFTMVEALVPSRLTGIAMGFTNMMVIGIGGLLFQPVIGLIAEWRGLETPDAGALSIILFAQILSIAILTRLPKVRPPEAPHIALGRHGENLAAEFLRRHQYKILSRNFRAPHGGEVDIICRDITHNELVFIEIKTRSSEEFGRPFDAVNRKKRRLILRGAMTWLKMLDMPDITFRFDVIEIVMDDQPEIRHIENAFQLPKNYSY